MILEGTIILGYQVSWYRPRPCLLTQVHFPSHQTAAAVHSLTTPAEMKKSFFSCSLLSTGACRWSRGLAQPLAGRTLKIPTTAVQHNTELFVQIAARECIDFRSHFHVVLCLRIIWWIVNMDELRCPHYWIKMQLQSQSLSQFLLALCCCEGDASKESKIRTKVVKGSSVGQGYQLAIIFS